MVDQSLQESVYFRFIKNKNRTLTIELFKCFHFDTLNTDEFKNLLQYNVQDDGDYIRVADVIHSFNLHDKFEMDEILIPFIMCNPNSDDLLNYLKMVPTQGQFSISNYE